MIEPAEDQQPVHPGKIRHAELRKGVRWFLAEILVVVVGILVAMSLNSWYQDRQDAGNERDYLQRMSHDLQDTIASLQEALAFEQKQYEDGILASRALSASIRPTDTERTAIALSNLGQRKTMLLKDATYLDLVNTGNLRLIHDTVLRDRITRFYQNTARGFEAINKNNTSLVDDSYRQQVLVSGLVMPRGGSNLPALSEANREVVRALGDDYRPLPDRLWSLPPDAPEWAIVRGNLLMRVMVASTNKLLLAQNIAEAQALKASVDEWLDR